MNQNEPKAITLNRDDAAILTECSNGLYDKKKIPRLVINTASYSDENGVYPAQSVTLYGDPVRSLYLALRDYFEDSK
jgi:hypothetical protein